MEQWETWRTRRSEKPLLLQKKTKKKHQFRKHQGAISTRDMPRSRIGKRLADVESGWLHKLMTDLLGDERDQSSLDHWSYAYHDA
jgi:uncharacterized membrane protein